MYNRVAPRYGQVGTPFVAHAGERLVALAGVRTGDRVLDVGAWRGAVLFPAATRVGPSGYALGIDLAKEMVRETTAEIARRGLRNAAMRRMDAEALDLPDASFDAVLCSFAIFFFPRLGETLREFLRVLRPEGVLGIALSRGSTDPRWRWQNDLVNKYSVLEPPPAALQGRALHQPGELVRVLAAAGFADGREEVEEVAFAFRDEDEWWDSLWTHGERRALEAMTPEALARFKAEAMERLAELKQAGGLTYRLQLIFALARKPETSRGVASSAD